MSITISDGVTVATFYCNTNPVSGIFPHPERRHPRPAEPLGSRAGVRLLRLPLSAAAAEQTAAAAPPSAQERRNAKVIHELLLPNLYLLMRQVPLGRDVNIAVNVLGGDCKRRTGHLWQC